MRKKKRDHKPLSDSTARFPSDILAAVVGVVVSVMIATIATFASLFQRDLIVCDCLRCMYARRACVCTCASESGGADSDGGGGVDLEITRSLSNGQQLLSETPGQFYLVSFFLRNRVASLRLLAFGPFGVRRRQASSVMSSRSMRGREAREEGEGKE